MANDWSKVTYMDIALAFLQYSRFSELVSVPLLNCHSLELVLLEEGSPSGLLQPSPKYKIGKLQLLQKGRSVYVMVQIFLWIENFQTS